MKSHLLIFAALVTVADACEARESGTDCVASHARPTLVAATQSNKSTPSKPAAPAAPATPTPKPTDKNRGARPARPEYLFL